MDKNASDKVDIAEALKTGLIVTSSLAFAIAVIYLLAFFKLIGFEVLRSISFFFIIVSMLIVFNICFSLSLVDQLLK